MQARWWRWLTGVALVLGVPVAFLAAREATPPLLDVPTTDVMQAADSTLDAEHEADMRELRRILLCGFFQLPDAECADRIKEELLR